MSDLKTAYAVDAAIMDEKKRLVVIYFSVSGSQHLNQLVYYAWKRMAKYAIFYCVDTSKVEEFNAMYDLQRDALMFFYHNRHISGWFGHKLEMWIEPSAFCELLKRLHGGARHGRTMVQ